MSTIPFDTNEILTCLRNTYQSQDKNIRTKSEQKLTSLINQNLLEFVSNITELFKKESDKNLRLSIILFLKHNIEEKAKNNLIKKEDLSPLINKYIPLFVEPNLSKKELNNFKITFLILLDISSHQILLDVIDDLKSRLSLLNLGDINGFVSILSCLINSSIIEVNKEYFISVFNPIIIIAENIVENYYKEYLNLISKKINMEDYYQLNNIFFNIFELFFDANIRAKNLFEKIEIGEDIIKLLDNVYIIGIKLLVDINAKDNNRIISWTGQKNLDKNVNNMKIIIFKYINLRLIKLKEYMLDETSIQNHDQMIKIVLANLEWVVLNKYSYLIKIETSNIVNEYPDYSYTLLISFMLIYLKRILSKKNFVNGYNPESQSLFKNVLLPLLILTEDEEKSALDNDYVNDFLIDMNDIIYENRQKNIKSQIGGLIKKILEKNAEINNFMITYTINLIYFLFEETQGLCDKKLIVENDIIFLLIKAYNREKIIAMLFLVLNLFNENKKINKEQNYDLLDNVFRNIFSLEENNNNIYPLLKFQLIIFISNYSIKLYLDEMNIFEKTIKYLYEALFDSKYLLISNSAADSIQKIFEFNFEPEDSEDILDDEEEEQNKKSKINNIKYTLLKLVNEISGKFEKQILETQVPNFFDVLSQILISFEKIENNFFKNIFVNICERIKSEAEKSIKVKFVIENEKEKNKKIIYNKQEMLINKCFNIIKILLQSKAFLFNNYDLIENSLRPLLDYMEEPEKIKFDEDIIYIIYLLMKERQKVIGIGFNLIKYIFKYINKCGSLYLEVYQLLDLYISYGTNQIVINKTWYEGIFNALMSGLKGDKSDKGILYTCMVIQTWIIHCTNLPKDKLSFLFKQIFIDINSFLDEYNESNFTNNDMINFLGYTTTVFSVLINYGDIVNPLLQEYFNEKVLKNWLKIIVGENEVIFEYEIKILIYSICLIIKKEIFRNEIYYFLNLGLDLLKCQKKNSLYQLKQKTKKALNINFIEDDDEIEKNKKEEDSEEEEEDIELKEMKILIERTSNPIKNLDEFKLFNDMLQYLKNNKNEIYSKWENSLSQVQKEKIIKLIYTKRINIQINDENNMQVARRIVSIKRTNNN